MSLIDERARLWLPLDESAASLYPSDASGHVGDPSLVGATKPGVSSSSTLTGYARDFIRASAHGFEYLDPSGAVRLVRDLTVLALVRVDVTTMGDTAIGTLIQRGRGGASDPKSFELRVTIEGTQVRLSLRWQTEAGVDVADTGIVIAWPTGDFVMLGAVREVVAGEFTVRYFVNEVAVSSADDPTPLDCGGALSASLSLGCGMTSPTGNTNFFDGAIDGLAVLDEALTADEAEWLYLRLSRDQPDGSAAMRRLVPPGVYSTDPSSRVQLELSIEGAALGYVKSLARRLRDYNLPSRAWGDMLSRWEAVTGHSPKAGDWLARRRERVLSFLGTVRGYGIADVREQLREAFDYADAADVVIVEADNDFTEAFSAGAPSESAKIFAGGGAWSSDATAVAAGKLAFSATAADIRYRGRRSPDAGRYLWSLDGDGVDAWIHGRVTVTAHGATAIHGFAIGRDDDVDDWLFVGVTQIGGDPYISARRVIGADDSPPVTLEDPWLTSPTYFRIHTDGDGNYLIKYGASDAAALAHAGVALTGPTRPKWAGFSVSAVTSSVTTSSEFDDFFTHAPGGGQRLSWYAYRDPLDPGAPDMERARLIVERLKPAHTSASAVQVLAVKCDDAASRCDREPIGA